MRIDLHTHSFVSDGTDAPAELVGKAVEAGLDVVALTDHDTFDGLDEARRAAAERGIGFLGGLEISTQRHRRPVHLLGYGCDPNHRPLRDELTRILQGRTGRIPAMAARLTELGMPLEVSEVMAQAGDAPSVGRPHVADALVARGYVADRDEAFALFLDDGGPAYVGRYTTALTDAIALVHAARGVAVLAHPWGRGRRGDLPEPYLAELARTHGLDGVEVDHPDHDDDTRAELRRIAGRLGVVATGSSDFHGLGKTRNPLGACTTAPDAYAELLRRVAARGGRP